AENLAERVDVDADHRRVETMSKLLPVLYPSKPADHGRQITPQPDVGLGEACLVVVQPSPRSTEQQPEFEGARQGLKLPIGIPERAATVPRQQGRELFVGGAELVGVPVKVMRRHTPVAGLGRRRQQVSTASAQV